MLARGSGHQLLSGGIECLNLNGLGLIHQYAIGNDLGVEPGGAELLRHVFGGLVVFRARGDVRLGGQGLQVFAGQFGIGHGEELLLDACLLAEVGIAEDLLWRRRRGGCCRTLRGAELRLGGRNCNQ